MVVAEADHRADGEPQHLVGGAGPDAADHRQEVPVAERRVEAVSIQEVADGLGQLGLFAAHRDAGGQLVEAHQVGQHAQEARAQQVAALGEHGVQVAAAPLQAVLPHLHREGHVRRGRLHLQFTEQAHQVRIRAVVEHQETGVDAVGDGAIRAGQGHVDRVGVAAEVVTSFEQRDLRLRGQAVGRGQPGNARANNRDALHRAPPAGVKTVVRRPAANEGGREEEENRFGISARRPDRPHNRETCMFKPRPQPNTAVGERPPQKVPPQRYLPREAT